MQCSKGHLVVRSSAASLEPNGSGSGFAAAGLEPRLKRKAGGRQTYKPSSFQELVEDATDSVVAVRGRVQAPCVVFHFKLNNAESAVL